MHKFRNVIFTGIRSAFFCAGRNRYGPLPRHGMAAPGIIPGYLYGRDLVIVQTIEERCAELTAEIYRRYVD